MSPDAVNRFSREVYERIWDVLVRWFHVPASPPQLPVAPGDAVVSFRPSPGFLRLLKLQFWLLLALFDGVLILVWIGITAILPILGVILFLPLVAFVVLPDIAAYVAIHLRYDTTWYVLTKRSLRVRRGIWILHETTITFENVQDVVVQQGPIERFFGVANVVVHTAGGGSAAHSHGQGAPAWLTGHVGILEGVANAAELRELIMSRVRASKSAGLGDEPTPPRSDVPGQRAAWTAEHLEVLRGIRDAARSLAKR